MCCIINSRVYLHFNKTKRLGSRRKHFILTITVKGMSQPDS